jgi:hypothetical protein
MKDELVITEGLLESSNKLAAEDATEHKQIQTLFRKHQGWGIPRLNSASTPRALRLCVIPFFFCRPLFSQRYELLFPQTYFHNHPHCPGVCGSPPHSISPLVTRHSPLPYGHKQKAPPCDGASATYRRCLRCEPERSCLPAEAVHQAALEAQVVLLCAAKVGVQILELDRAERHVAGQLEIGAAAKCHGKGVHRR